MPNTFKLAGHVFDNTGSAVGATVQRYEVGTTTTFGSSTTASGSTGKWAFTDGENGYDIKITYGSNVRWLKGLDELQVSELAIIQSTEGAAANFYIAADQADDDGDSWRIQASDVASGANGTLAIANNENATNTFVDQLTLTAHATPASTVLAVTGSIKVGSNIIQASDGGSTITMDTSDNVTIAGDLTISGDDLKMATNTDTYILVADGTSYNPVAVSGDIAITNAGVTSIASGVIVNADINGSAAIDVSKTALTAGTGISLSTNTLNVDASQAITALTGGDLTIYEDANNADVSLKMGTSATEALFVEVLNGGSNKTAEEIRFTTTTASATANHGKVTFYVDEAEIATIDDGGKYIFDVDGTDIVTIDDGGIDLASGKTFAINGSDISTSDTTYSAGTNISLSGTTFNVDDAFLKNNASDVTSGTVTMANLIIGDAGNIGSATDTDAIAISSGGVVNFTQAPTVASAAIKTVGTENIWVPATAMTPRDNAGCAALATVAAGTNGRPDFHVLDFDKDSDEHAQFNIAMPKSWDGGNVYFYVYWIGLASTDGVAWGLQVLSLNDNEEFNQAYGTAVVVTDASQGDVTELLVSGKSGAIGCSGADNDLLCFQVFRDVSDGSDDMAGDARLFGLLLEYTTNAATDA